MPNIYQKLQSIQKEASMDKLKTCSAWLPPGFGIKCDKPVDPICRDRCFQCCQRGNGSLPENNYLRCSNSKHPPYVETKSDKQVRQFLERTDRAKKENEWKYPYANEEIPETKVKLRNAIKRDIKLLKSLLPLEECLLPDEDDTEMWDSSNLADLEEEIDKVKLIINHPNGLQAKLSLWEDFREEEETNQEEEENYE